MESVKLLAQADITAATTEQDLYTVSDSKAVVFKAIITNRHSSAVTVRLSHSFGGGATAVGDYRLFDYSIPANSYLEIKNLAATNADVIRIYASHTDVTFAMYGSEFDQANVYIAP